MKTIALLLLSLVAINCAKVDDSTHVQTDAYLQSAIAHVDTMIELTSADALMQSSLATAREELVNATTCEQAAAAGAVLIKLATDSQPLDVNTENMQARAQIESYILVNCP